MLEPWFLILTVKLIVSYLYEEWRYMIKLDLRSYCFPIFKSDDSIYYVMLLFLCYCAGHKFSYSLLIAIFFDPGSTWLLFACASKYNQKQSWLWIFFWYRYCIAHRSIISLLTVSYLMLYPDLGDVTQEATGVGSLW